jgi:hypothetical protein
LHVQKRKRLQVAEKFRQNLDKVILNFWRIHLLIKFSLNGKF